MSENIHTENERKISELKEALRDHINWHKEPHVSDEQEDELNEQLKKLDGKNGCNHESDFIVCEKCAHPDLLKLFNKASGSEKDPSECHSEIMGVDSSEDNSKPPELIMIPTLFGTVEELEKRHKKLQEIAKTIPTPDIEELLKNEPRGDKK